MGFYRALFSISVEHAFFADGACKALEFVPTAKTAELQYKSALLIRSSPNGVTVFCEEAQLDDLRRDAADPEKRLSLSYKVYPTDPYFGQYTHPSARSTDEMLYFDSMRAANDANGRLCLHEGDFVSASSFQALDSPALHGKLDKKDILQKPGFVVDVAMAADNNAPSSDVPDMPLQRYYLRFAARQSLWKYYFLGDLAAKDLYITDLDNKIGFEHVGSMALPGNRRAQVFISNAPIPMQETHGQRFQLRENGQMGEKVLIKRLPNAVVSQINKEVVDGRAVLVSEMYVN